MFLNLAGKIWKRLSPRMRWLIVRLSQDKFTASAGAVVTDAEGKVLLLEHVFRPSSGWGIPGGFIEPGEQPETAVAREVFEETGVEIAGIELRFAKTAGTHIEFIFSGTAVGGGEIRSREILSLGWFAPDSLPEEMHPSQKATIMKIVRGEP